MLAVLDVGISNIGSVLQALRRVGAEPKVINTPKEIGQADTLILPGVGAFEQGMANLRQRGLITAIRELAFDAKRPIVGVCLGMQLLADRSQEGGAHEGLGFVEGEVVRLRPSTPKLRVPNIGWSNTIPVRPGVMFPEGVGTQAFYYVHSYHFICRHADAVAAKFVYGTETVTAAVERENVFGVQFHPEKSQDSGFDLLERLMVHVGQVRSSATA